MIFLSIFVLYLIQSGDVFQVVTAGCAGQTGHNGVINMTDKPRTGGASAELNNGALTVGNKIYFIPGTARSINVYNPNTNKFFYHKMGDADASQGGWTQQKFSGAAASDSFVYFIPKKSNYIAKLGLDAATNTQASTFLHNFKKDLSTKAFFNGAIKGENGLIYMVPANSNPLSVGILDPSNDAISSLPINMNNSYQGGNTFLPFSGAVSGPTGSNTIYFVPYNSQFVGKLDTSETPAVFSLLNGNPALAGQGYFSGGVKVTVSVNNRNLIIMIPAKSTNQKLGIFDPYLDELKLVNISKTYSYSGGVESSNGLIYFAPKDEKGYVCFIFSQFLV